MAERAASARAAARRAACWWAASADERSAARAALSTAMRQRLRGALRRWSAARARRGGRRVEALEPAALLTARRGACRPPPALGLGAVGGTHEGGGGARRQRQHLGGCRDVRSCVAGSPRARRCDCSPPRRSGRRGEPLRRALGFDRRQRASGAAGRGARVAGGARLPAGDATKDRARVGGGWRCTPRTEVGSCCCSGACTGRRPGVPALARAVRRGRPAAQQVLGPGWRHVTSCGRRLEVLSAISPRLRRARGNELLERRTLPIHLGRRQGGDARGNCADGGRQLLRRKALAERLGDRNRVQPAVVAVGLLRRVLHSREAAAAHAALANQRRQALSDRLGLRAAALGTRVVVSNRRSPVDATTRNASRLQASRRRAPGSSRR